MYQIMDWITDRIREVSSHNGLMVALGAAAILFGGFGITKVLLWGALGWGVWSMLRTDD
jgi:hypothetical protein